MKSEDMNDLLRAAAGYAPADPDEDDQRPARPWERDSEPLGPAASFKEAMARVKNRTWTDSTGANPFRRKRGRKGDE